MSESMQEQELMGKIFEEMSARDKRDKVERYRRLNKFVKPGQILFVGSSLMEQFPVNELLMDLGLPLTVYNRGIGGFTTQELAEVLDVCVYDLKPRHVFINIGTNDLNGPDYRLSGLLERYESILRSIQEHLPGVKLYLLAYYPVNPVVGAKTPFMAEVLRHRTNERIGEANAAVQKLAEKVGAAYLDVNAGITDENGNMDAEYAIEGMHMYGDGYMQVLKALLPTLEKLP